MKLNTKDKWSIEQKDNKISIDILTKIQGSFSNTNDP